MKALRCGLWRNGYTLEWQEFVCVVVVERFLPIFFALPVTSCFLFFFIMSVVVSGGLRSVYGIQPFQQFIASLAYQMQVDKSSYCIRGVGWGESGEGGRPVNLLLFSSQPDNKVEEGKTKTWQLSS